MGTQVADLKVAISGESGPNFYPAKAMPTTPITHNHLFHNGPASPLNPAEMPK